MQRLFSFLPQETQSSLNALRRRRILQKKRAKLSKNRAAARAKYGVIPVAELIEELRRLGIAERDLLFVQTSFNDLYTLESTPKCLIEGLRQLVGATGTLLMPAYTIPKDDPDWAFDVNKEPTYTGVVNEVFRRSEGVIRSLHPRHSICGIGPQAAEILRDHEKCTYADGVGSPFDKMRAYPNAKILTLGLPKGFASFLHWIEDFEPAKLPFPVHDELPKVYRYIGNCGEIKTISDYRVRQDIAPLVNFPKIAKYFSSQTFRYKSYKSITLGVYTLEGLARELPLLRDQGILHYFRRRPT